MTTIEPWAELGQTKMQFMVEKLRYLLAHETRILEGPPDGNQEFGSVDRHFNVDREFDQIPIGDRGEDWGSA